MLMQNVALMQCLNILLFKNYEILKKIVINAKITTLYYAMRYYKIIQKKNYKKRYK